MTMKFDFPSTHRGDYGRCANSRTDLNKDTSGVSQEFLSNNKTVAEIARRSEFLVAGIT